MRAGAAGGDARIEAAESRNAVRLGDYVLLDRIGSGGSGVVHRAWQISLQRFVAVKLVGVADGDAIEGERFLREARMAAGLAHPHIVPIYEVGVHEGRHFLVMRLVTGPSLNKLQLPHRRAVELMVPVAMAIEYAHHCGIVHRDLKPHNLIIESDGHVWVTDFGLARSTRGGTTVTANGGVLGTPAYMPPEQARGQRCDERSDVYSLGATLYEMLAGKPPFDEQGDLLVQVTRVLTVDPPPLRRHQPRLPANLETIVAKAMAKDPDRRYQTAGELADDLRRHLHGEPIAARPPGVLRQVIRWARRHPVPGVALACALALGLGGLFHTFSVKRQLAETTLAEANALGAAGQWEAARLRYEEAGRSFWRLGLASVAPELGLLDAHHQAPRPVLVLPGHRGTVRGLAFLPDGRRALSASDDGTLRLWDVPRAQTLRVLRGHTGGVTSVALSDDGSRALSGGADGSARVWEVETGRELRRLDTRGGAVLKVALAPGGRRALTRTDQGVVQLWDLGSGRELRSLETNPRRVVAVAFSPDGRLAVTGRNIETQGALINARASLWETETGRELQTFGGFTAEVESWAFSPDGRRLLSASYDRMLSVWDVASGRRLMALKGHMHGIKGAAFSARDRILVSGGLDNIVNLWDADTGQLVRSFDTGSSVEALALSPDGRFILTGGDGSALELWDVTVGHEARAFAGHDMETGGVALFPDGRLAASVGVDPHLRIWDVATGREVRSIDLAAGTHTVAVSPDGKRLATGARLGNVRLWDVATGAELLKYRGQSVGVRGLAFSPDGRLLISGEESGWVRIWDSASGLPLQSWQHQADTRGVAFSPDGRLALSASYDGTISLREALSGREVLHMVTQPPEKIGAAAFSPDGRLAVTGDDGKAVRLWDLRTGRQLRQFLGHRGDVRGVAFSPDGRRIFSASRDRSVRVWDVESGHELHAFPWSTGGIRSFALSPDGRFGLAGSDDGSMNLWDFSYVANHRALQQRLDRALGPPPGAETGPRRGGPALAALGEWYAFRGVSGWALELLAQAEAAGEPVSRLMMARCHWQEGDFSAARRDLALALDRHEAPAEYLQLLISHIGPADQAGRLSELSQKDGRVRFPFLGLRARDLGLLERTDPASGPGRGALVTRVLAASPAALAGLRAGDIILRADEQEVNGEDQLAAYLASRTAGATVSLSFLRAGLAQSARATLAERPPHLWEPDGKQVQQLRSGYVLQTMTPTMAMALGLDLTTQGALVTDVGTRPPVELARKLRFEDVITRVDGRPVASADDAAAALEDLPLDRWGAIEVLRPGGAL
jgi:WD40 repeat protein